MNFELVEAARTGNAASIEHLIESIWGDAYRLARAMIGETSGAQDVAQEACISVYRSITALRSADAFRTWFYRIVLREANRYRKRRMRSETEWTVVAQTPDRAALIDLWRALATLPHPLREVVVLHYFEDLSSREIAPILRVPDSSVRFRLMIARRRLRAMLGDHVALHPVAAERMFMRFDLHAVCKAARADMHVSPVPMAAIRAGALAAQPNRRRTNGWLITAAFAAITCSAAAAIQVSHVSFPKSGGIVLSGPPASSKRNPSEDDIRVSARGAGFDVVLPSGLPQGWHVTSVMSYVPDAIALKYQRAKGAGTSDGILWVLLARQGNGVLHRVSNRQFGHVSKGRLIEFWNVGNEQVYLDAPKTMTASEVAAMKASMGAQ